MRKRDRQARKWRKVSAEMTKAANRVEHLSRALAVDDGVQPSVSRTGHLTLRCETCNKVCYRDRRCAEEAVARIPDPMTAYFSSSCGWWHLATERRRDSITSNTGGQHG